MKADEGEAMFQGRPLQEWETGAYRARVAWLSQASSVCWSLYICVDVGLFAVAVAAWTIDTVFHGYAGSLFIDCVIP